MSHMLHNLKTKVEGTNDALGFAMGLHPLLSEWLTPFIGTTILKADGTLKKSINDKKPIFSAPHTRWHLSVSNYSIFVEVDKSLPIPGEQSWMYRKTSFMLAEMTPPGILKDIVPWGKTGLKDYYNHKDVESSIKKIEELKKEISQLEHDIYPFIS
jgi:hypothetical protein